MKAVLFAASAIGLIVSAPAYAAEKTVNISATVGKSCGLGHHKSGYDSNPGWNQDDIVISNLIDANGQLDPAATTISNRSFGNIWCNSPADVSIELAALAVDGNRTAPAPADASSFTNKLDLKLTGNFGGHAFLNDPSNLVIDTTGDADGVVVESRVTNGAFETGTGQYSGFQLQILNPGNKRPVAGNYAGYVKVTATPAA